MTINGCRCYDLRFRTESLLFPRPNHTGLLSPRSTTQRRFLSKRHSIYLSRQHAAGVFDNPSRGLYLLADSLPSEHQSLAEAYR